MAVLEFNDVARTPTASEEPAEPLLPFDAPKVVAIRQSRPAEPQRAGERLNLRLKRARIAGFTQSEITRAVRAYIAASGSAPTIEIREDGSLRIAPHKASDAPILEDEWDVLLRRQ